MLWCHALVHREDSFFFPHPLVVPWSFHLYPTIFHLTCVCLQHPSCFLCYMCERTISDNVPTWFSERCLEFMWENCLSQVFTKDFAQKRSRPICQICCKVVHGVWGRAHRCSAGHGQQFIHWHRLGMCLRCLTILCYFDSCHLKENKTAAVIRVGQKAVFILAE